MRASLYLWRGPRVHGRSSCGAWAELPVTNGILVLQIRMEPTSPALEVDFLTSGPPGTSPKEYHSKQSYLYLSFQSDRRLFSLILPPCQIARYFIKLK